MVELSVIQGDITRLEVDAIVNAANNSLLGGSGVDGAIHSAAGPELLAECKTLNGCETGQAKITRAYRLPAQWIIHTVGPIWKGGHAGEADKLAACYKNSLQLALEKGLKTIAFPAISCGVYGYPIEQAAKIAVDSVTQALAQVGSIEQVYFVCFDRQTLQCYQQVLNKGQL